MAGNQPPFRYGDVVECIRETEVAPGSNMGPTLEPGRRCSVGRTYSTRRGWVVWFTQWDDIGVRYPADAFKYVGRCAQDPSDHVPLGTLMSLHNEEEESKKRKDQRRKSGGPRLSMSM